jgi:hypothetical protein
LGKLPVSWGTSGLRGALFHFHFHFIWFLLEIGFEPIMGQS